MRTQIMEIMAENCDGTNWEFVECNTIDLMTKTEFKEFNHNSKKLLTNFFEKYSLETRGVDSVSELKLTDNGVQVEIRDKESNEPILYFDTEFTYDSIDDMQRRRTKLFS